MKTQSSAFLADRFSRITFLPHILPTIRILKPQNNLCHYSSNQSLFCYFPAFGRFSRSPIANSALLFDMPLPRVSTHSSLKIFCNLVINRSLICFFQTHFNPSWKLEIHHQPGTVVSKPFASQFDLINKVLTCPKKLL